VKKFFLLVFLSLILIFLFLKKDKTQERPELVSPKVIKETPPVKKEIIITNKNAKKIPNESDEGDIENALKKRKEECDSNEPFYKNKPVRLKDLNDTITEFFEKSISSPEAEVLYQRDILKLETDNTLKYDQILKGKNYWNVCRGKEALAFLDKLIEAKNLDVPFLLRKINNQMLANHFTEINLALVFGKLSKMSSLGLIPKEDSREIDELRKRYSKAGLDFANNIKNRPSDDLAQGIILDFFQSLNEVGVSLKQILEKISY